MALKIIEEVTVWDVSYRQPNHVYLADGEKVYAYVPWGKGRPVYFKTFQRMDRRGRRFVEVKRNKWKFDLSIQTEEARAENPRGQIWTVAGSKGAEYTVSLAAGRWSCSCPGNGFRGRCRHVDELRASNPQLV